MTEEVFEVEYQRFDLVVKPDKVRWGHPGLDYTGVYGFDYLLLQKLDRVNGTLLNAPMRLLQLCQQLRISIILGLSGQNRLTHVTRPRAAIDIDDIRDSRSTCIGDNEASASKKSASSSSGSLLKRES